MRLRFWRARQTTVRSGAWHIGPRPPRKHEAGRIAGSSRERLSIGRSPILLDFPRARIPSARRPETALLRTPPSRMRAPQALISRRKDPPPRVRPGFRPPTPAPKHRPSPAHSSRMPRLREERRLSDLLTWDLRTSLDQLQKAMPRSAMTPAASPAKDRSKPAPPLPLRPGMPSIRSRETRRRGPAPRRAPSW